MEPVYHIDALRLPVLILRGARGDALMLLVNDNQAGEIPSKWKALRWTELRFGEPTAEGEVAH
jgi:hypothetical protein